MGCMAYFFKNSLAMAKPKIHIGTSGWSYKHWKEIFYPSKLKTTLWFDYYAQFFDSSEINTSFYHLPKEQTVINWASKAPPGFSFCPKLSRFITHMKKLRDVKEPLQRFFEVFAPLEKHMGPVLVQLPPMLHFRTEVVKEFFEELKVYKKNQFVLEVRHDSWLTEESFALMRKYKIGFVISQSNHFFPYAEQVTSRNIYVRFHGPGKLYASGYTNDMLNYYTRKFKNWMEDGYTILAYFNNDIQGYAFRDAMRLAEKMGIKKTGKEINFTGS